MFIAGAAGIVVTGLITASPLSLLSGLGQGDADLALPKSLPPDLPLSTEIDWPVITEAEWLESLQLDEFTLPAFHLVE
jgi:hypothetical protein